MTPQVDDAIFCLFMKLLIFHSEHRERDVLNSLHI